MAKEESQAPPSKTVVVKKAAATKASTKTKKPTTKEKIYGDRSMHHHGILQMSADELHEAYPFTVDLIFNTVMTKKEFHEKKVPDASCLFGTEKDGTTAHRFVIGNEQGEILPQVSQCQVDHVGERQGLWEDDYHHH